MAIQTNKTADGTSFYFVVFFATPKKLKELFPNSYYEQNNGKDKTNFDFTLETKSGNVFTIYDWKQYRKLKMNEIVEWHIGGENEAICLEAKSEILELLNK